MTGLIVIAILTLAGSVMAGSMSSARSVAMGDAYIGLAQGVEAGYHNPANLGLNGYRHTGLELMGVGVNLSNNSFTLNDYNSYTGAFLTDGDKADILGKIPESGLRLSIDADASVMSFSFGSFAFTAGAVGAADINLSKDIVELIFNGNTFADTISVTGSYSEAVGYAYGGLSYGVPIYTAGTRQLSIGSTIKYIRGLGIEEVVKLEGGFVTEATGFGGSGEMVAHTATGGSGYALDLGAALKLSDSYTAGVQITNVLSSISWSKGTEEHGYTFNFDTMTVDNMGDDFVTSDDYSIDIPSFKTSIPAVMTVGIANTSGSLVWAVDWEQGFRQAAGASTKPRLSAGVEWKPIGILPLRVGYASGGHKNTAFSFGSGLHLSALHIDFATVTGASLGSGSAKGVNVALSMGLHF